VEYGGKKFIPGQGNNVYIFPAVGMAVLATESSRVPEELFITAAKAVADQVTEENLASGLIYPPQSHILEASLITAEKIAEVIFARGLARIAKPADIGAHIRSLAYKPQYTE
jgi:malate dehydrogenase (oxaloacetate-decarboxylating)(NADP+)